MRRKKSLSSLQSEKRVQDFIANAPRRIFILVYPGASIFDVAATSEAFSTANGQLRRVNGLERDVYSVEVVSPTLDPVKMEMGIRVVPDKTFADPIGRIGTLVLAGGCWDPIAAAAQDPQLIAWIKRAALRSDRIASMCTGAFLLAAAELAKTTITTHWAHCDRMRKLYPHLNVSSDNIYVKEGNIYSSAGSTAAMDLALALIEEDLGHKLAMEVACRLVMLLKRPGGQSQFSAALLGQAAESESL